MAIRILLVSATEVEADALKRITGLEISQDGFSLGKCHISLLVTGVGSVATSWTMAKWLSANPKPDLAINIGIAGSYREEIKIGDVVVPVSDCFADAGIEDGNSFMTLAEAGLSDPNKFPFKNGKIDADNHFVKLATIKMKPVNAITVNTASGSGKTIDRLSKKYNPDIETMEGATFFYICSGEKIPFLALRSISNRVETRNKDNWNIPFALDNLSEKLKDFLLLLD
ncbi:MAG: futalosine hydrolase [Bacteroidia bacterium]|nr:futalosine hydrolase [Bacteroidia bacterium]